MKLTITLDQLKALQDYYEMYGVSAMQFDTDHLEETLETFGPTRVETTIEFSQLSLKPTIS